MREIKFDVKAIYGTDTISVIAKGGDCVELIINKCGPITIDAKRLAENLIFAITFAGNDKTVKLSDNKES